MSLYDDVEDAYNERNTILYDRAFGDDGFDRRCDNCCHNVDGICELYDEEVRPDGYCYSHDWR